MLAFAEQLGQHLLHLPQRCELLADTGQSGTRNLADGTATTAVFQTHQFANFLETEPKILRSLDESNPVNRGDRIAAHGAAAMWDSQQTTALVIPYRFDTHLGRPSEFPNSHSGGV